MWRPMIARSLMGDNIRELNLKGSKCGVCKKKYFPARKNCPHCMKEDTIEDIKLSDHGKLQNYVVCGMAPPGYEVPHVQGYIDLDEGGPRIFALLTDYGDETNLKIGSEMKLTIVINQSDKDGVDIAEYRFRPV